MRFLFPQIATSVIGLGNSVPTYIFNMSDLLESSLKKIYISDKYLKIIIEQWNEFLKYILTFTSDILPFFGDILKIVASSVSNIILGVVVSIYLLIDKEKFFGVGK